MNIKTGFLILILVAVSVALAWHKTVSANDLELIPITITDNGPLPHLIPYNNLPAFDTLVPRGWAYEGGVVWDLKTYQMASMGLRLTGSDGLTGVHIHPFFNYIWDPSRGIGGPTPFLAQEGQYISGAVVQRPLTAAEYLWNKVITPKRPQAEFVDQQNLPRLAQQTLIEKQLPGIVTNADAAKVRIRYVENGITVEEDFYTVILSYSLGSTLNYTPVEVYSLRAPQGQLDTSSGLLYTLVRSNTIDRVWYANYLNISQLAIEARQDEIRLAGEIARLLVNDANQIHESQLQEWTRQQTVRDSIFDAAVDTILGVEDFRNPSTGEVTKLPGHYQIVWWGIDGSYTFTNDPNVNPALGSNIDWFQLERIGF